MLRLPTIQIIRLVRFPNLPHTRHHNYQFFTILGSQSSSAPRLSIKTPRTLPLGLLLLLCHLPFQRRSIYLCNCLHLTEAFISDGAPKLLTEDINDVPNKKLHICLRMSFLCPCVVLKGDLVWAGHGSDGAFFLAVSFAHDNYYSDAQWWAGAWPGLASSRDILITLILLS